MVVRAVLCSKGAGLASAGAAVRRYEQTCRGANGLGASGRNELGRLRGPSRLG